MKKLTKEEELKRLEEKNNLQGKWKEQTKSTFVSTRLIAKRWGVTQSTVFRWCNLGLIPNLSIYYAGNKDVILIPYDTPKPNATKEGTE